VRTTDDVGRWGGARAGRDEVEISTFDRARKLFAGLSRSLEGEIFRLEAALDDEADSGRIKSLHELIRQSQKALQTVLDQEVRLAREGARQRPGDGVIDLAEARSEIARGLARLAG
jgi:hypothetical protein